MNSNIGLVAFDLGNVLCTVDELTPTKKLVELSGLDPDQVHEFAFGHEAKLLFESGKISFAQHAHEAMTSLGIDLSIAEFTSIYDNALIPSTDMFPLVARIAESHRIALVSNTSEPHWKSAKRFLPFSDLLDLVIVSYAVESMKPDAAFYQALLDQTDVPAAKILFIDDLEVNIDGVRSAGMVGHQFTSQTNLERALATLNVI